MVGGRGGHCRLWSRLERRPACVSVCCKCLFTATVCGTSFWVSMAGKLLSKSPMSPPEDVTGAAASPPPPSRSSSPSATVAALSPAVLNWFASSPRAARSRARKSDGSVESSNALKSSSVLTSVCPVRGSVKQLVHATPFVPWSISSSDGNLSAMFADVLYSWWVDVLLLRWSFREADR